jgi:hypothetical protein
VPENLPIWEAHSGEDAAAIGAGVNTDFVGAQQRRLLGIVSKDDGLAPVVVAFQKTGHAPHLLEARCAPDGFARERARVEIIGVRVFVFNLRFFQPIAQRKGHAPIALLPDLPGAVNFWLFSELRAVPAGQPRIFMVAAQEDAAGMVQLEGLQRFHAGNGIFAAIDAIAQEDQCILLTIGEHGEQLLEQRHFAMYIANGVGSGLIGHSRFRVPRVERACPN